jgi:hypothetical protein
MKNIFPVLIFASGICTNAFAQTQIPFSNQTALLPTVNVYSGNSIGVCDMNNDGKDDIVRAQLNQTMIVSYQQSPNGNFTEQSYPGYIDDPWAMCVGDVNDDGYNDVLYGFDNVYIFTWNGINYTSLNVTQAINAGYIFVQGTNFADVNHDGNIDVFACNDDMMPHVYLGNGAGGWTNGQSYLPLATVPATDNSGNYASIWTDINNDGWVDLMITHCRQGVTNSADGRRIDQVFFYNGNGTYTQDVTNTTGLRDGAQGWSTAWGDIDNDGDMDAFVLNYDVNSKLMINNGSGVFADAMSTSGIANTTTIFGENATFHDFNNDGFNDLYISGSNSFLYINNGNGTFTADSGSFDTNQMTAHAVGDLNGDGFLDIYASYCNIFQSPSGTNDKLWMNMSASNGNTNHYIKFNLQGTVSNRNALGAIVKIYGPWGTQVREVRSGEGYGIQNSFILHFGLGVNTAVDSAIIHWPSGITEHMNSSAADSTYNILEGSLSLAVENHVSNPLTVSIFPNPASDYASIRIDHFGAYGLTNLTVNVYDVNGKLVYTEAELQRSIIVLDKTVLNAGLYFVEVRNKTERVVCEKLLIQ